MINEYLRMKALLESMTPPNLRMDEGEAAYGIPAANPDPRPFDEVPRPNIEGVDSRFPEAPFPDVIKPRDIGAGQMKYESGYEPAYDPQQRMLELYKPEYSARDRLNEIIGQRPERENPHFMRKVAASLLGFGGNLRGADEVLHRPYYNKLEDWKTQFEPAEDAARFEHQSNQNMRMLANSILSQEMANERLENTIRHQKVTEDQGERRLDQGDRRLTLAEELANGGTVRINDDGSATLLTKRGERIDVTEDYENMPWEEKQRIKDEAAERRAKIMAKIRTDNQRPRVSETTFEDEEGNPQLGVVDLDSGTIKPVTKPGGETVKPPMKEIDQQRDINQRARELIVRNPKWKPWIKFDRRGQFESILEPPSGKGYEWFGFDGGRPSQEEYDTMVDELYGNPKKKKESNKGLDIELPRSGSGKPTNVTQAPVTPAKEGAPSNMKPLQPGNVRIRDKETGKTGQVRKDHPMLKTGKFEVIQ